MKTSLLDAIKFDKKECIRFFDQAKRDYLTMNWMPVLLISLSDDGEIHCSMDPKFPSWGLDRRLVKEACNELLRVVDGDATIHQYDSERGKLTRREQQVSSTGKSIIK